MYFSYLLRIGTAISIFASSLVFLVTPAHAQTPESNIAKLHIDTASRQRMLSQRMVKAVCFISTGIEVAKHQKMLADAHDLFFNSNAALLTGSEELGFEPEKDPAVFAKLLRIDSLWEKFSPLLQDSMAGNPVNAEKLAEINKLSLKILRVQNDAVQLIQEEYSKALDELPETLARTIGLAGRQRMFTQEISKDFCLIDAGVGVEEDIAELAKAEAYFSSTMDALLNGFSGVVLPAPTEEIRAKLEEVQKLWDGPKKVFLAVAAGAEISDADRATIANDIEIVLTTMNEAVQMYDHVND